MAQSPFLVDQIQIEPGATGTRLINRDSEGSLQFQDPDITSVLLKNLVGARNISGVYVVGSGDGAAYTTIQGALDAVSDSSSATNPSVVLVYPGVYPETLTLQKDGVMVQGLGSAVLQNSGLNDTLEISASQDATPKKIVLRDLRIECSAAAKACVRVVGADTFASGTITVVTAPLTAGDSFEIGGVTFTGIEGTRTSGSDNFNVLGDADAVAAEIAATINDTSNSLVGTVTAEVTGAVVTITAATAGAVGNAITLSVSTTVGGALTVSGATLSGGGSDNSLVASEGLLIDRCELVASGAAAYQVVADTCGPVDVRGGSWRGSDNASLSTFSNCSRVRVHGLEWANDIEVAYDTSLDRPSDTTSAYSLFGIDRVNEVLSNLLGEGSLSIGRCPQFDTGVSQDGDRTLTVLHSSVGDLVLEGTTAATLTASTRSSATAASGTPTLAENKVLGSVAFAASNSGAYAFDVTQPDSNYSVLLENPSIAATLAVSNKTTAGFDIDSNAVFTGTVGLLIVRDQ